MELTNHHDHPVVVIRLQDQVEAVVIPEVPDQVSDLLLPVADPQVLSLAEEDPEAVAPAAVDLEVEEETKIIKADFLIQIITKNEKVV
jgi:hypothetical protein